MVQPIFTDTHCDLCNSDNSRALMPLYGTEYHECQQCQFIYARPMAENLFSINEDNYERAMDKYVDKIDKKRDRNRKKLKSFHKYKQTGNFLEIGCNTGNILNVAKDLGWQVKGVDISTAASTFAREQMGLDVFTGSVEAAHYPDDFFDVVYCNATMEHVRHPLSILKEVSRILRPGGVFYGDTVNWDSYTRRILGPHWKLLNPIDHVHLYTPANVHSLCKYSGLEHVKTWTTGFRVVANQPGSTFKTPWYYHLLKGPLSFLARRTNKGDSIEFLLRKPRRSETASCGRSACC